MHHTQDLINIFNRCFLEKYNTQLVKGSEEPLYLPADSVRPHHTLFFAHGFFASALHESSHWLIAGAERRKQVDFGYWYTPDGRTNSLQKLFQTVEVKPQALEWILSKAAGAPFHVSIDNLNGSEAETLSFKLAIFNQVKVFCEKGLAERAQIFRNALCEFYQTKKVLQIEDFDIESI
jgi:elongation factor P hydroxylase